MHFIYRLYSVIFFLFLPLSVMCADSAPQALTHLLAPLQSLQANFVETTIDATGQVLQKNQGKVTLQRPGRFRWEILHPTQQLLIANGHRSWLYDMDLQQVLVKKQEGIAKNSPAALLSDSPKNLTQQFNIDFLKDTHSFHLKPKDKNALFRSIILIFKKNKLREMRLIDNFDQQTVIDFLQLKSNTVISAKAFQFVLPTDKQVEIVEG